MVLWLALGLVGHILCGVCDGLMSYGKDGRLDFQSLRDPERMAAAFARLPLGWPLTGIVLGVFSITVFGLGYLQLCEWMRPFSQTAARIMFVSALVFLIPITAHHIICGFVEWMYVRLGRTGEAREAVLEFQKKTISTMVVGYLGDAVFLIALLVMIASGRTPLPRWACVFNTLPMMLLLSPTKLPAKGNIAGALMFLGLLVFML